MALDLARPINHDSPMPHDPRIDEILEFWFGPDMHPDAEHQKMWWVKSPELDASIRERFGAAFEEACGGGLDSWLATPRGTLAHIILLDQFSRNLFRDDPRAWAMDGRSLALVLDGLERGVDRELPPYGRSFFYMPLMHAEDRGRQAQCLGCIEGLLSELDEPLREEMGGYLHASHAHKAIVDRFGRFPHRNGILGRESTDEEREFLTQPGSSF